MDNPINISGQELEDKVQLHCVLNNLSYQRAKTGSFEIDFIIETDKGKVYADCTNQNVGGSVEEKLPHKIWKYYKKYKYDNVLEHCKDLARVYNFDLKFVSCEQFCNSLNKNEESFFG